MHERFDPDRELARLQSTPQLAPPAQCHRLLLTPPPGYNAPRLVAPQQTFEQAFAPYQQHYFEIFRYTFGWLGDTWQDYAQHGLMKLWDMWQRQPDLFETHPFRYIIRCAMNAGNHRRADARRDKHQAFSLDDVPQAISDAEDAQTLYLFQAANMYLEVDVSVDFGWALGQALAEVARYPSYELIQATLLRVLLGEDNEEIAAQLGVTKKKASNYRYKAFRHLKEQCEYLYQ